MTTPAKSYMYEMNCLYFTIWPSFNIQC